MKVLVTGAAGWIGSSVVAYAKHKGHQVAGVDAKPGVTFQLDLSDEPRFVNAMFQHGWDLVIHCAGVIREQRSKLDPYPYWRNNLLATGVIVEAARLSKTKLLFVSTAALNDVGEWTPYSLSKYFCEVLINYARDNGLQASSIRLHNPYGPGQPEDFVVPLFMRKVQQGEFLRVGRNSRDYTYIGDIARFLVDEAPSIPERTYDIGTGHGTTDGVLAHTIINVVGKEVRVEFPEKEAPATNRVARDQLVPFDWTNLEEGLQLTWQSMKK